MKKWYCIIQGRDPDYYGWKQIIKDIIHAETKKEAREIVRLEYLQDIPMRIKRENVKPESLLLSLYQIEDGHFTETFFETRECSVCGKRYRPIDRFNLFGFFGGDCCSPDCDEIQRDERRSLYDNYNSTVPVIYKITQISTGKVYIGKTTRAFTLRWWEHVKDCSDDKFHTAISNSDITDWIFQVIEVLPVKSADKDILEMEKLYIEQYDSVKNGFNTVGPVSSTEQGELL